MILEDDRPHVRPCYLHGGLEAVQPFRSRHVTCHPATRAWELRAYYALRRRFFCEEQGLFEGDDRDAVDERAIPIVAVACLAGMPDEVVGVVRIWEEEPGHWWGGRLGTRADYRRSVAIGQRLVQTAVGTACRRGCVKFLATVQLPNVGFFERMHWTAIDTVPVCGVPHVRMEADLAYYREGAP
jgi:putative N-acetyltransferase (TIGR04045 family)